MKTGFLYTFSFGVPRIHSKRLLNDALAQGWIVHLVPEAIVLRHSTPKTMRRLINSGKAGKERP